MSKDETPISDQLKKVVDDLDLESKVKEATAAAEQAVLRGLEATGSYLRDHRADIEGFIERAGGGDRPADRRAGTPTRSSRSAASWPQAWRASPTGSGHRPRRPTSSRRRARPRPGPPDVTARGATGSVDDASGWAGSTDQV